MNEFNNLNEFDVIDTNINNTINNSIDNNVTPEVNINEPANTIETDNFNDELNNIVMSYVNDESNIVESPIETFEFNPTVQNTEEKIEEPATDIIAPVQEEEKPLFESNNEFSFDTFKTDASTDLNNTIEESTVVEDKKEEDLPTPLFTFDIETPVVPEVKENVENFTFDANGIVAPNTNDELITSEVTSNNLDTNNIETVEETPLVSEKEIALNEIIEDVEAIKEDIKVFNELRNKGVEVGLDQSPYLASTFENVQIYPEIVNILDKNKDEYVESVKKAA